LGPPPCGINTAATAEAGRFSSKVSAMFIFYSKLSNALTFENFPLLPPLSPPPSLLLQQQQKTAALDLPPVPRYIYVCA